MTNTKSVSPYEELAAMLVFGSENSLSTVGEVALHLVSARSSLLIGKINHAAANEFVRGLAIAEFEENGPETEKYIGLAALLHHVNELCEVEALTIERDIIVMESWLMFMDAAAGTDRTAAEPLQ
jgi:hypothetical protein